MMGFDGFFWLLMMGKDPFRGLTLRHCLFCVWDLITGEVAGILVRKRKRKRGYDVMMVSLKCDFPRGLWSWGRVCGWGLGV